MNLTPHVDALLPLFEPEGTVVTLTLDLSRAGIPVATRTFLKDVVEERLRGPGLEKTARRIRKHMGSLVERHPETNGLFLVAGTTAWVALELQVPMRNFITITSVPYLLPLLEARARAPRVAIARFDLRTGLVQEVDMGVWSELGAYRADALAGDYEHTISGRAVVVRTRPHALGSGIGGGRRSRFDESRLEFTAAMVRKAARELAIHARKAFPEAILGFGDREGFPIFRDHLPPSLRSRARYVGPTPWQESDLRAAAYVAVERLVHERTEAELLEFHERRAKGTFVALGSAEVLDWMNQGKVARLYLDTTNPVEGSRCLVCNSLFASPPNGCPHCDGRTVGTSLAQEALAHGLKHPPLAVTFVPTPAPWLGAIGGMAALLSAKGMRVKTGGRHD
ncbi:MAG: hypothetical protein HYY16_17590 [Planctomycetes bacterium]|nr:hypothetical protein [Planctomycetota bacterium]